MLDAHRLMIFRSVAATGSVAAAAASLGYTPSAVSQHVAALQRETGLKLLERVGRGVELTPAGRVLATEADGVLSRLNDLGATVDDLRAGKANRITMNVFATAGTHWMPAVVQTLSAEFPDTRLRLRIEDEVTEIAARRPDLAVAVRQEHGQTTAVPGFSHEDLVVESYVAVVPEGHAFAAASWSIWPSSNTSAGSTTTCAAAPAARPCSTPAPRRDSRPASSSRPPTTPPRSGSSRGAWA